ncbi:hypothetical protein K493DRAFT_296661 [Basidiobolus meristosporus CBS 931.73]|uniref:Cyclin-domain-containing protein n=1 Tax=Basidiobolus meristosporus CBS 931.73 TaxID=1314790 RepID=A0A1Y1Z4E9_9FUNG|nr:hypothetical protein K493DRAFT_296661 [Basidiobolus meristosporus CBS 931.73]|eukprot:ORY05130.1 hypothetical protein K493DRAFT_296661 [Basidiobolus meristosporus CBS 931.73]
MFHTSNKSHTAISRQTAVDGLLDAASIIVDSIWPDGQHKFDAEVLPLRDFIKETIRRSKSTFSVLQVALLYLIRIKGALAKHISHGTIPDFTKCGRRMFIASLILATKYLQDKNYMNRAWAKIMGVKVAEINHIEKIFLQLIDYQLYVPLATFSQWCNLLLSFANKPRNTTPSSPMTYLNLAPQVALKSSKQSSRFSPYPSPTGTPCPSTPRRFSVDAHQQIVTPQESPISCAHSPINNKAISQLSIAYIVNPTDLF